MKRIDVIVPIYKGQCYVEGMISQLEQSAEKVDRTVKIGLILVNDDPKDYFRESYCSEKIDILAMETDQNRGIHGARVRGLTYCTGDYVVFLDQDDRISPDYFVSQLGSLGEADAVICRAINGGRLFYAYDKPFKEMISLGHMFSKGNGILSPGQVLMRREAIPQFWQENILRYNGADDWLLWICMLYEGMRFAENQAVLYEHVIGSENSSGSAFGMYQSEREMYGILREQKYLDTGHLAQLWQALQRGLETRLKELDRLKAAEDIYAIWLNARGEKVSVAQMLKLAGYKTVAIYGMGKMGMRLYQEIKMEIEVKCYIDRNAAYLKADIPIYTLEDDIPQVDLVIIALADREHRIQKDVSNTINCPVKGIEEILRDMLAER